MGGSNPRVPKFEILALSAARQWVQVGALFELSSNPTPDGEVVTFLNGKIEDPSLDKLLYISAFRQEDGSYNVVWSRPTRSRNAPTDTVTADDGLPPLPGADEPATPVGGDGLGKSSADGAFSGEPPAAGGRHRRTSEIAD